MIPDIAFMIVVYGCARLAIAVLDPYRQRPGQGATIAAALSWVVAVFAVIGLLVLGVMVAQSSLSISDLTK
jgi:hypothetical protein